MVAAEVPSAWLCGRAVTTLLEGEADAELTEGALLRRARRHRALRAAP
jgi:hypothetical protein